MSTNDLRRTGTLAQKRVVMPADLNTVGTLFGGTMLADFDLAGSVIAMENSRKPVVSVAMNNAKFIAPVPVGNTLAIYGEVSQIGRASITIYMQAWKHDRLSGEEAMCAEATATYVCVNDKLKPVSVR